MNNLKFEKKYPDVFKMNEEKGYDVNPLQMFESFFFGNDIPGDYRLLAIDKCIENKEDFTGTFNSGYELISKFTKISCPTCGDNMRVHSGDSSGGSRSINYRCSCGSRAILHLESEAMSFELSNSNAEVTPQNEKCNMTYGEFKCYVLDKMSSFVNVSDNENSPKWKRIYDTMPLLTIITEEAEVSTEEEALVWLYKNNKFEELNKLF